jgi:hypothetical protein
MGNSSNRGTTRTQSRSKRSTQTTNDSRSQRSRSTQTSNDATYTSVAKNIYRDGSSYRARVSVNGIRESRNFRTKREAVQWRNEMIAERA